MTKNKDEDEFVDDLLNNDDGDDVDDDDDVSVLTRLLRLRTCLSHTLVMITCFFTSCKIDKKKLSLIQCFDFHCLTVKF